MATATQHDEVNAVQANAVETLNIDDILDLGVRDYEDPRTKDLIAELALQNQVEPGEVVRDAEGKLWQKDGGIRRESRRVRGEKTVQVSVTEGTRESALVGFLKLNSGPRAQYVSNAEKARAVLMLRELGMKQAAIVTATGIPKQTVSDYCAGRVPTRGSPNSDAEIERREKQREAAAAKREAQKMKGWRLYDRANPTVQYEVTISRQPALHGDGMTGRWEVGDAVVMDLDADQIPEPVALADILGMRAPCGAPENTAEQEPEHFMMPLAISGEPQMVLP